MILLKKFVSVLVLCLVLVSLGTGVVCAKNGYDYSYVIDGVCYNQHGSFGVWSDNQKTDGFIVGYDVDVYDGDGVYVGKVDIIRHSDVKHSNSAQAKNWRYCAVTNSSSNVTDDDSDVHIVPVDPVINDSDDNVSVINETNSSITNVSVINETIDDEDNVSDISVKNENVVNNSDKVICDNACVVVNGSGDCVCPCVSNNMVDNSCNNLSSVPVNDGFNSIPMQHTGNGLLVFAIVLLLCVLCGLYYKFN